MDAHFLTLTITTLTLRCLAKQGLEGLVDAETDASRLALLAPQHEGLR